MGTRFPVRPSMSGLDGMIQPSTSPDPPPIPTRSHERMRSTQISSSQKQPLLLSPPEPNMGFPRPLMSDSGSDVTVRPKRHGIITPRGPEGAAQQMALSPSALHEAFNNNLGSRPSSRAGSTISNGSFKTDNIFDISRLVYNATLELYRRLHSMRSLIDVQNASTLKAQIDKELRLASVRMDNISKTNAKSQKQPSAAAPTLRHSVRQLIDLLGSMSNLSRLLSSIASIYCRSCTSESYRTTFWSSYKDTWEMFVMNSSMSEAMKTVSHSRQTSTSSFKTIASHAEYGLSTPGLGIDGRLGLTRSTTMPSPSVSTFSSSGHPSSKTSVSGILSPLSTVQSVSHSRPGTSLGHGGHHGTSEDHMSHEIANDPIWERVNNVLRILCERANEGFPRIQQYYSQERQRALRSNEQDSETVRLLTSLTNRSNTLLAASNALRQRLDTMKTNDRSIRHSVDFWQIARTLVVVSEICVLFQ